MKKILFGTTALLAAGAFASAAQASDPIKLQLGGYMEYWVAASDQDGDYNGNVNSFDVQGESEIWFVGKTTLDNGMTIGVQVELEAGSNQNGDDTIDESYLFLEGKYGKLIVGSENDVAYLSSVNAPEASDMGIGIGDGDTDKYLMIPDAVAFNEPINGNITGDANKLSYFTPKIYGFQLGVSATPSGNTGGDDGWSTGSATRTNTETMARTGSWDDAYSVVVNYSNDFSGVGVKANAAFDSYNMRSTAASVSEDSTAYDYGVGLQVSYMGFTVGGGFHAIDSEDTSLSAADGYAWDAGLMYAEGPYAVSFSYTGSSAEGDTGTDNGGNDKVHLWKVGAKYALGPGVNLFSQIAYMEATNGDHGASSDEDENDGAWGGVVGLKLVF